MYSVCVCVCVCVFVCVRVCVCVCVCDHTLSFSFFFNAKMSPLVDDFREVAQLMLKTHRFSKQVATGGRVEFLPIHWHTALFGDSSGVDE